MPLELTDFNQAGLEVDALALIVAVAPPNVYADADRGGSQSPESGELGIGPGQTLISRIGITSAGENVRLNDNDNPVALTLRHWFGQSNETSTWRLYIQTDGGVAFSQQLGNIGGGYANFQYDAAGAAILNAIAAGDRFLIALARRLLPVAASIDAQAGSATAALTKQAPANKAVAASFGAAAGSVTVAVMKQGGSNVTKPVAAAFMAEAGSLAVALGKTLIPQPRAALAVSESSIETGRSVELRWVTSEAESVEIDQGIGAVPLSGSLRVSPERATTYTLTATGQPGSTPATASVTVTVTPRAARSLLPPNATEFERAMEAALRQPIDIPIRKLWSSADCPLELLPYLAWALGVEDWDSDWPEAVKRAAVRDAFRIHREKGTLAGLKRVLMNAGAEYEYVERPSGVPMTARLSIFNSNAVYLPDITASINRVKRASLDLDIVLASAAAGDVFVAAGLGATTFVEISDWGPYAV